MFGQLLGRFSAALDGNDYDGGGGSGSGVRVGLGEPRRKETGRKMMMMTRE